VFIIIGMSVLPRKSGSPKRRITETEVKQLCLPEDSRDVATTVESMDTRRSNVRTGIIIWAAPAIRKTRTEAEVNSKESATSVEKGAT